MFAAFGLDAGQPDVTSLIAEDISIRAGIEYTFIFSSWSSQASVQNDLDRDFGDLATDIKVTTKGMTEIIVMLTPIYEDRISVWIDRFAAEGLTDLKSFWAGVPQTATEIASEGTNISTVTPVLVKSIEDLPANIGKGVGMVAKGIGSAAGNVVGGLFSGLGLPISLAILGIGGFFVYSFVKPMMPSPKTHTNPRRYRRRR